MHYLLAMKKVFLIGTFKDASFAKKITHLTKNILKVELRGVHRVCFSKSAQLPGLPCALDFPLRQHNPKPLDTHENIHIKYINAHLFSDDL